MRRLLKNRKALSPVVAAIILIAVTVAVSIAVAAWMGALTVGFMQTEELSFINYGWDTSGNCTYISINVKNTGSQPLTITEVRVSDALAYVSGESVLSETLNAGDAVTLTINLDAAGTEEYTSGTKYEFVVITAKGNSFGPYIKTAP
ncbi:MAG: hypothetical protein JSV35_01985 [Candidatus Bathyarchaeota archaeon]|nr:MAG: hypothetical protein JSV35_01985 [Candidatus Bathyarchaeota archaeon]